MLTYNEIEYFAHKKRYDLIMLRKQKLKLIEDKNKLEVYDLDIRYSKDLDEYLFYSKLLLKKKYEKTKRLLVEEK